MTSSIIITASHLAATDRKGARIRLTCRDEPRWTRVIDLAIDHSGRLLIDHSDWSVATQVAEYLLAHGIAPNAFGSIKPGEFAVVVSRMFWDKIQNLFFL